MEKIENHIMYEAFDGKKFESEVFCRNYESLLVELKEVMSKIKKRYKDNTSYFMNGVGCVQHDKYSVLKIQKSLLSILGRYYTEYEIMDYSNCDKGFNVHVARLINEYCNVDDKDCLNPLESAWYRIMCMDEKYREWGHPFFAQNPSKRKEFILN